MGTYESHQIYLAFTSKINGKDRYFIFTVFPSGLTTAPFIFTKALLSSYTDMWKKFHFGSST